MVSFKVLVFVYCLPVWVVSQPNDKFLICKSVNSLFDFEMEPDLDNIPSGTPREIREETQTVNHGSPLQNLKQQLKDIRGKKKNFSVFLLDTKLFIQSKNRSINNVCRYCKESLRF